MSKEKTAKKGFSFGEQLDSVVCCNRKAMLDQEGDGYVRLKVMLQLTGFAKWYAKFFPIRDYRKYVLSGFSLTMYRMIRTEPCTLRSLIQYLADTEKLSFLESRALILQYVGSLMRRGLVVVEVPRDRESGV